MPPKIREAQVALEEWGLKVSPSGDDALMIAGAFEDVGDGIRVSQDACVLIAEEDRWLAVFPGPGMTSYEVPGRLEDLLPLIRSVYTAYRSASGSFATAFPHAVADAESYRVGGIVTAAAAPVATSQNRRTG